jgi:WD40 repeat protein
MIRAYTRVAVVQLAFHPAIVASRRSPLEDPLFEPDKPDSLLPDSGAVPPSIEPRLAALRARIRDAYSAQILARAGAVLAACRALGVRVAVFPENSVPWEILGRLADLGGDMVLVAGSHTVDLAARGSGLYERLGLPASLLPEVGRVVCPVLHRGRLLALTPKLLPRPLTAGADPANLANVIQSAKAIAGGAHDARPRWTPVAMPAGIPGPMGVLLHEDLLHLDRAPLRDILLEPLRAARFLAVPSLPVSATSPDRIAAQVWDEARRYGKPVLYAGRSNEGGTTIFTNEPRLGDLRRFPDYAGYLEPGDEGAVVADVDLGLDRSNKLQGLEKSLIPVAEATLLYRAHPVADAYAQWIEEAAPLFEEAEGRALAEVAARVLASKNILLNAGALSDGGARDRRLKRLLNEIDKVTDIEEVRQFTREIVLSSDILPLPVLRGAMARGAADAIFEWLPNADAKAAGFGEVEARLRGEADKLLADASSWARGAIESISAVRQAVRGAQEGEIRPPVSVPMQIVLPASVDPAALGVKKSQGFLFDFRARPDDFRDSYREAEEARSTRRGSQLQSRLIENESVAGADLSEAHLWVADELYLLAIAEGADRVGVVAVRPETSSAPRETSPEGTTFDTAVLLVLSATEDGWIAREAGRSLWLSAKWQAVQAALAGAGISRTELQSIPVTEYPGRILCLLDRIEGARDTILELRRQKLREVEGHFVPPDVLVNGGVARRSILEALDEWLASDEQTALILGEFGAGKSTSLAEWTHRNWESGSRSRAVLVNLATAPRAMDAEGLLLQAARAADTRQNRAALRLLLRRRLVIACFDGFDEMATRLEASDLAGRLSGLLEVGRGGGKVVVTSRDNYFPSEEDLKTTSESALLSTLGASAGLRRLVLQPFSEAQVRALVEKIRGEAKAAEEALFKIAQTYDLRDLVSRPLLLGMVLATLDQIEPGSKVGTADLYEAYLLRWLDQTRSGDPECFTDNQKVEFAEAMADQLWRSGRATCTFQELQQSVRARLAQYLPSDMPAGAAFLEIQGGAFFVREGEDHYRFAHKSFLEYFLARAIVNTIAERPKAVLNTKPLTKEVAAFMGEILRRKGGAKEANAVRAMQTWLAGGMADAWSDDTREVLVRERAETMKHRATAAANAARLLLELGRWAGEPGGWIPEGADLHGVRLIGEDMRGAKLVRANLEDAHLSAVDLREADLKYATLKGAILSGAKLDSANLAWAQATKTDFIQAEAHFAVLIGADLSGALLRQSMWIDCVWDGANLTGADITATAILGLDRPFEPDLTCPVVPPEARASLLTGVSRRIGAPSFSPDSIRVATSGKHGTARIWDARSGQELMLLAGHEKAVTATAWSPDGALLATASDDGSVRLWHTDTGAEAAVLRPGRKIRGLAWHPSGDQIAIAVDDHVELWGSDPELQLTRFSATDFDTGLGASKLSPVSLAFSPSGDLLGSVFADLSKEADSFRSLGAMLTLWSPPERKKVASAWHSDPVSGIAFHPSGSKLAGMSERGRVVFWDVLQMRVEGHFDTHDWGLLGVDWHWKGLRVASHSRDMVHIWDAGAGARAGAGQKLAAISAEKAHEVAWSPDGARILLTTHGSGPRVWDIESGMELARTKRSPGGFRELAWGREAPVLATSSDDGAARLWSTETGQVIAQIEHDPAVSSMALHPDGRRLAYIERGLIRVWNVQEGAEIATLKSESTLGARLLWHPDGARLASEEASGLTLWDVAQGRVLMRALEGKPVRALGWSPSGEVLSYLRGDSLHLWDIARGAQIPDIVYRTKLSECAWSVSGLRFAAARSGWVWIFDLIEKDQKPAVRQVTTFPRPGAGSNEMALSPGGDKIAIGEGPGAVTILDIESRREVRCSVEDEHRAIRPVAFSHDGARIAGIGSLGAYFWETGSGRLLCSLEAVHQSSIARTPGGFCVFGGGDPDAYRLALRRPAPEGRTVLFLPLGHLREALDNPAKVASALRGDLDGDDARAALEAHRYAGGERWNGEARRAPEIAALAYEDESLTLEKARDADDEAGAPAESDAKDEITAEFAPNTLESIPPLKPAAEKVAAPVNAPGSAPPATSPLASPAPPSPQTSAPAAPVSPIQAAPMRASPTAIQQRPTSIPPIFQQASQVVIPQPAPLLNPFRPGPALTDQETLPGRELVLNELLALIDSRSPAVLRGPRRSGKTSILYTIEKRLTAAQRPVRRITLEGSTINTADDLARVIDPTLRSDPFPGETLRAILRAERRAVVLLDEVANLFSADPSLFAWLRAIGQEEASLVFAGSHWDWVRVVERAASAPGSSFGNDVTPVTLGPISEADAIQFLTRSAPPDVPIEEDRTARWIVDQCGPWPFYLQVMGFAVVHAVRAGTRLALVERRGVSDLYEQRLLVDRDPVFRGRWAELPERARRVLRATASAPGGVTLIGLPAYKDLSRDDRKVLRDTGLCNPLGQWLDDRPFFDWIRRSADDHEGGQG